MTETPRLLVVSPESTVLRELGRIADSCAWEVERAGTTWDAVERLQCGVAPQLLVLDLPRGDDDTVGVLKWLRRVRPNVPVMVICFQEDAERNAGASRLGAQEVLFRPFDEATLELAIRRNLAASESVQAAVNSQYIEQIGSDAFFVCAGPSTQKLRAQAELLADAEVPVLILGEPGSGKDTAARLIHKLSSRSGFELFKVNCSEMSPELLDVELFGAHGTSSQGIGRTCPGKLERADRGTIFLDEITALPLDLQAKLMEVLQDGLLRRSEKDALSVDVRILAGTSADTERAVEEGKLREDLYYRLSAFTVQLVPLRDRSNEIGVLLGHAMYKLARHFGLPPREFSSTMLAACRQHSWPGNMKELEAFVTRYLISGNQALTFSGLEPDDRIGSIAVQTPSVQERLPRPVDARDAEADRSGTTSLKSLIQGVKSEAERNAIGSALQRTGWNRKAAARLLQVSYRTLLYKIDQYHIGASDPVVPEFSGIDFSDENANVKAIGKAR